MFDPDHLKDINFEKYSRIAIAFSGGLDSSVLLQGLASIPEYKKKLFAIHVNHGISPNSDSWLTLRTNVCLNRS